MAVSNVLITGAGTATCQSVIKGLRAQRDLQVRIITTDSNEENAGRYLSDKFYKIPLAKDASFIPMLLDICRNEQVQLLIPIVDWEFEKFSASKNEFEKIGCKVSISDAEVIGVCDDKWKTFRFFQQHEIPAPKTALAEDWVTLGFPIFVKPRTMGRASLDTYIAENKNELELILKKVPNPLLQQVQRGTEYTIDTLSDFDGNPINAVIRERVETKSGVSYKGKTVKDQAIMDFAAKILQHLPLKGVANIQCFKQGDEVSFIEINPRFSGGLALSLAAGFNSPLLLLKMALGEKVPQQFGNYNAGVTMLRYWQEVFVDGTGKQITL